MRLHEKVKQQAAMLEDYQEGLKDLVRYLNSPKFKEDPTVQVRDILLRISETRTQVADTEFNHRTA